MLEALQGLVLQPCTVLASVFEQVNLLSLASNLLYAQNISNLTWSDSASNNTAPFVAYDSSFHSLISSNATSTLVASRDYEFVHEAGIYNKPTNSV